MLIAILILVIITAIASILALVKALNSRQNRHEIIDEIVEKIEKNFTKNREENHSLARQNREEINNSFKNFNDSISQNFTNLAKIQSAKLDEFAKNLQNFEEKFVQNANDNRLEQSKSLQSFQEQFVKSANENRAELAKSLKQFEDSQQEKFTKFFEINNKMRLEIEQKLDSVKQAVENKLQFLQEENNKKLEKMRETVDEKLQATVEKRFDQSFKVIGTQLNDVQKGLGEMQNLASGVGDLKKVLANVKTRGNIGEIQLGAIIEQYFSAAQYEQNAAIKENSTQRVEYAIKIPSKDSDEKFLLLPIDSKFPIEDYQRLTDALESIDATNQQQTKPALDSARRQFETAVKKCAKDIHEKYLEPPKTTDFGVMFVPTEGLYAEILRSELFEELQKKYHVVVLGPTTIVAFLSALQMGFRTLAVEKKSSDVWRTLGAVKTEFGKFGDALSGVKNKISQTVTTIEKAETRSRQIERKLKNVEALPEREAKAPDLLGDILDINEG